MVTLSKLTAKIKNIQATYKTNRERIKQSRKVYRIVFH